MDLIEETSLLPKEAFNTTIGEIIKKIEATSEDGHMLMIGKDDQGNDTGVMALVSLDPVVTMVVKMALDRAKEIIDGLQDRKPLVTMKKGINTLN